MIMTNTPDPAALRVPETEPEISADKVSAITGVRVAGTVFEMDDRRGAVDTPAKCLAHALARGQYSALWRDGTCYALPVGTTVTRGGEHAVLYAEGGVRPTVEDHMRVW